MQVEWGVWLMECRPDFPLHRSGVAGHLLWLLRLLLLPRTELAAEGPAAGWQWSMGLVPHLL